MGAISAGRAVRRDGDVTLGRPVEGRRRPWTTSARPPLSRIHPRRPHELSTDPRATIHGPPAVNPQSCPQMWVKKWSCADAVRPVVPVAAGARTAAEPTLVPRGTRQSTERDEEGCDGHALAIPACAERGLADGERFSPERHAETTGTTEKCERPPVGGIGSSHDAAPGPDRTCAQLRWCAVAARTTVRLRAGSRPPGAARRKPPAREEVGGAAGSDPAAVGGCSRVSPRPGSAAISRTAGRLADRLARGSAGPRVRGLGRPRARGTGSGLSDGQRALGAGGRRDRRERSTRAAGTFDVAPTVERVPRSEGALRRPARRRGLATPAAPAPRRTNGTVARLNCRTVPFVRTPTTAAQVRADALGRNDRRR